MCLSEIAEPQQGRDLAPWEFQAIKKYLLVGRTPFGGTKILLKTENYTFIEIQFMAFWCMVQKYGKSLLVEINRILSTEMDVLRVSARKSRMGRMKK